MIIKNQTEISELKNALNEPKTLIESFSSRQPCRRISELKDRSFEISQLDKWKEKRNLKSKERLQDIWNTIKRTDIHIMGF